MQGRRNARFGLLLAVGALGFVTGGCLAPTPGPPAGASLSVSPNPANFPNSSQAQGFPMPNVQVTVTNTGGHVAGSVVVHPVGVYSVPVSNCSSLGPGQSCTANIQFCPSSQGTYDNQLSVTGQDTSTGAALSAATNLHGVATP